MKYYDIIIIGGGASGLACAVMSKSKQNSVLIIEHKDRVGKKILSTGNGRCNLTNEFCTPKLFDKNPEKLYPYFTENRQFVSKIISSFDSSDTIRFFNELGMLMASKGGYVYPRSFQASSVLDVLRFKCRDIGVDIITGTEIKKISDFYINDEFTCEKLVISCGGMSAPKTGSDGSFYKYIKEFGHSIKDPLPALCAIKCGEKFLKSIAGVRCDSRITLFEGNKEIISSFGNLQFTSDGISGIPAFQISGTAARLINANHRNLSVHIDLLPEFSHEEIAAKARINPALIGVVNKKLAQLAIKSVNDKNPEKIAAFLKNLKLSAEGFDSMEKAQVTSGGVPVSEINPDSMESRILSGLYFTGEVIDVDGICGGYNLQWAWSTAAVCAKAIKK